MILLVIKEGSLKNIAIHRGPQVIRPHITGCSFKPLNTTSRGIVFGLGERYLLIGTEVNAGNAQVVSRTDVSRTDLQSLMIRFHCFFAATTIS